jgi:hypothetical protein
MSTFHFLPNPTCVMRPRLHGGPAARAPRKRRLQGALAGFGVGGGLLWRAYFFCHKLSEFTETLRTPFHPPKPLDARPALPRHEHH